MRIKVINPNTTASMTAKIGEAARSVAAPGTEIIAVNPENGPVSIEGHYDEAVSGMALLEEIYRGEAEGVDGYVIACFGDPGLLAAREVATGPVLGIAEAAMHAASFIATGFSVVTTLGRTKIIAEHLAHAYGMDHFCRAIRACELEVLALEDEGSDARRIITEECLRARDEDGHTILRFKGYPQWRQPGRIFQLWRAPNHDDRITVELELGYDPQPSNDYGPWREVESAPGNAFRTRVIKPE